MSGWLNAGVQGAQVAEWAGHSIAVLYRVYEKCIDGDVDLQLRRIATALGVASPANPPAGPSGSSPRIVREPPGVAGRDRTPPDGGGAEDDRQGAA